MFVMAFRLYHFAALMSIVLVCGWRADGEYTPRMGKAALFLSKAAYCAEEDITNRTCSSCTHLASFKPKRVISSSSYGTQGYTGVAGDFIVAVFRGSSNTQNWMNNLDFTMIENSPDFCRGCKTHRGFLNSYFSIKDQLLEDIKELAKEHPTYNILVTGHSLGGAIATLAAGDLAMMDYHGDVKPKIELYTFGSPRVGNKEYANWFTRIFCATGNKAYRLVQGYDIVPHTTTVDMGFVHIGGEIWYHGTKTRSYKKCEYVKGENCEVLEAVEDSSCSNNITLPSSIENHLRYMGYYTSCATTARVVYLTRDHFGRFMRPSGYG